MQEAGVGWECGRMGAVKNACRIVESICLKPEKQMEANLTFWWISGEICCENGRCV
jgi:hypothetical protein